MRKHIYRHLRFWTALFVLCGYLALATTHRASTMIIAVPLTFLALAPFGEWLDAHFKAYRKITMLFNLFCIFLIPLMIYRLNLMGSVITLIVYIQAYTLLHQKTSRNFLHLYLMSFFLLLASCVENPDPAIGLVMTLFLIAAFMSLMLFQIWNELGQTSDGNLPALVSLDSPDELTPLTPQRFFDAGLITVLTALGMIAILITSGIFVITPRMEAGLLGRPDSAQANTGLSNSVDLATGGTIKRDMTPVMRVEFPNEKDGKYNGDMLWRTCSLSRYENAKWERGWLHPSESQSMYALSELDREDNVSDFTNNKCPSGTTVQQSIYLDRIPREGIPCLPMIKTLTLPGNRHGVALRWSNSGDFVLTQSMGPPTWLQYVVTSEVFNPPTEQLRSARNDYVSDLAWSDLEMLTSHDLLPETIRLAKELTDTAPTTYDKALAISKFLNGPTFLYSLSPPEIPHEHPVDTFINSSRIGHCEFFASAMALMLRSLGIPTRVVTGYRGGEWTNGDHAYTVRADMAHLWVEVYFLDIGWVAFDPTPPDNGPTGFAATKIARLLARYMLHMKMVWFQDVIGYNSGFQMSALRNMAMGVVGFAYDLVDSGPSARGKNDGTSAKSIFVLLGGIVVLIWFVSRFVHKKTRRYTLTPDQHRATKLYRYLIKRLERLKIPCHGLTAEEIEQRAIDMNCPDHVVATIINTYNESRFGSTSLTPAQYRHIKRSIRNLHIPRP